MSSEQVTPGGLMLAAYDAFEAEHGDHEHVRISVFDAGFNAGYRIGAEDRDRLADLIERTIFALSLGGNGTLEEAGKVQRDHGNALANLYLDLCAARGRGHRADTSATADRGLAAEVEGLTLENDKLRTALEWQRHESSCKQCVRNERGRLCGRGNGLFSAMVDAAQALADHRAVLSGGSAEDRRGLAGEAERYRKTLEWYANEQNYQTLDEGWGPPTEQDRGVRARAALSGSAAQDGAHVEVADGVVRSVTVTNPGPSGGDVNARFKIRGSEMDDETLSNALIGLFAYDTGSVDSGIHDEALRSRVIRELRRLADEDGEADRVRLSRIVREAFLTEEALELRYGIEDVKEFIDWLSNRMEYDV
jgi:hypothetical protein